ncbi:MAG: hypothetical protein KAH00_02370, partial [Cocleimonas sp.]|nr:hypothetical protein [Cocleimonas sp.]
MPFPFLFGLSIKNSPIGNGEITVKQLSELMEQAQEELLSASDLSALDDVRVHYLGKKGQVTAQLKQLGQLPPEDRREAGQEINRVKQALQKSIEARKTALQEQALNAQLEQEKIDITLPGRKMDT